MYPATAASQSALVVACTFTSAALSAKYTVHDFTNAFYHQGEARTVVTASATAVGSATVTLTAASSSTITSFANHGIAGQGVPKRGFIKVSNNVTHVLTLNTPTVALVAGDPTTGPIPAGATLTIDNGTSRSVADGTVNNTTTVTSAKANFKTGAVAAGGDVGASISGTDIPDNATIATWVSATQVTISVAGTGPAGTGDINQVLSIGASTQTTTTRTVNDATYTATNKVTSAAAVFSGTSQGDIGMPISGPGISAGAVITAIAGNVATISGTVATSATAHLVAIGVPSRTAPADNDSILSQGAQLDLNPALIAGSNKCSLNKPEGFGLVGGWINPGSTLYNAALPFGTQPAGTAALAQILFHTSVLDYAAYIIQQPAGDATLAGAHYDLTFPAVPTGIALCASSPAGVGNSFVLTATTASQAKIPSGVGRPSTAQARGTKPGAGTFTARIKSDDGTKPFNIPQTCAMAATPVVDFHCGNE